MDEYRVDSLHDLVTPDGVVTSIKKLNEKELEVVVHIQNIAPNFVGFYIDKSQILFNLKSTLAQIGVNATLLELDLDKKNVQAFAKVKLRAIGELGNLFLPMLQEKSFIGKLFAADETRRVRDPEYLMRMFGRKDRFGDALLSFGSGEADKKFRLDKVDGYTVAHISLLKGVAEFCDGIEGLLPTIAKGLLNKSINLRELLKLNQKIQKDSSRVLQEDKILLVKTLPLHVRTVFAKVAYSHLPEGVEHTSADILEPNTRESGDIYELFGHSTSEIESIPLEFYTLEPYREYVFFEDRDQLQSALTDTEVLFKAFGTAPAGEDILSAVFIVKDKQLLNLTKDDWFKTHHHFEELPGFIDPVRQSAVVERHIKYQPVYPFLKGIQEGSITSQGILLTKYFPSPTTKKLFLSEEIYKQVKGIYFETPSASFGDFFSHEDRAFLLDLAKFAIPVYWVDKSSNRILRYVTRHGRDFGMFVPVDRAEKFVNSTVFGVYGSNLIETSAGDELKMLLKGVLELRDHLNHPLLNKKTNISLVTGGGTGAMELGNRIARSLDILSCANIVDFEVEGNDCGVRQRQNPYIEAKMTYRIDKLVERQAEFNLDFPIFVTGGFGTDFELALEAVRRKVGSTGITPVLLFGNKEYWQKKISSKFKCNVDTGTIAGFEWVSNCFYCVNTASSALKVYKDFFEGTLKIGKDGPTYEDGFATIN